MNGQPDYPYVPRGEYPCRTQCGGTMRPVDVGVYPPRVKFACDHCKHAEWWVSEPAEGNTALENQA